MALCLPPANFSNRFAVKHTIHNDVLHITTLAIDITRALNLSVNKNFDYSLVINGVQLRSRRRRRKAGKTAACRICSVLHFRDRDDGLQEAWLCDFTA